MSYVKTSGLVLREVEYKEADKILTVLTADQGQLTVKARGARRRGSSLVAATQVLTYSGFSLFESRGRYTVDEAEAISLFPELRGDLDKLALASYFAQLLENLADEDYASGVLLRLGLNSLYALCRLEKPLALVRPPLS